MSWMGGPGQGLAMFLPLNGLKVAPNRLLFILYNCNNHLFFLPINILPRMFFFLRDPSTLVISLCVCLNTSSQLFQNTKGPLVELN